ncbi:MAG: hypothetical protein CMLOHMNK_00951 [Steroidobacteraceae bacterium]|nr:hypothetical protein [Steroidobacteraceae bacterium]
MGASAIDHALLMRASEDRIGSAARQGTARQQLVARRLIEDPNAWRIWEREHGALMHRVATARRGTGQAAALKSAAFSLIERKALFEYLTERRLHGDARRRALALFHGTRAYTDAMIAEHGGFIRAACSHMCSKHIGSVVMLDGAFQEPMARYEDLFREYFRTFCDVSLARDDRVESLRALLPFLKHQVTELRTAILAMPRTLPDLLYEAEIRRPTGDTVRMRGPRQR